MRRFVIAAAGLAWLAGCASEPAPPVDPMPVPDETFPDPGDPPVQACLTVVSLHNGTPSVIATAIATTPEGRTVTVEANGAPWRCDVDDRGRVTAIVPLSRR